MTHEFGSYGDIAWVGPPPGLLGGARAVVSLRRGGCSPEPYASLNLGRMTQDDPARVAENDRRWREAHRLEGPIARARLVHGARCVVADKPGVYEACDGLLTGFRGLPLWITVADCYPVFLVAGPWVGLVHCGWRGTAAGAAVALVRAMAEASSLPPAEHRAWIGPGIGACCYPVTAEVSARFPPEVITRSAEMTRLDLCAGIRRDLVGAGIRESAIDAAGLCTSCRADLFFSHRRDGARSGRMAAVIWRE